MTTFLQSVSDFSNPHYKLVNNDVFERIKTDNESPKDLSNEEYSALLKDISNYVQHVLLSNGFSEVQIPEEDTDTMASTSILVSDDWLTCEKLLIVIQNASGSLLGIFSRSLCLEEGLSKGSMLNYIEKARECGYSVMVLRPNTNSVLIQNEESQCVTNNAEQMNISPSSQSSSPSPTPIRKTHRKVFIQGSESPEAHVLYVWENIIPKCEHVRHVVLLGYGNGASLCKDLLLRHMVQSKQDETKTNVIKGFVTIEASQIVEEDDALDVKQQLANIGLNFESSNDDANKGYYLEYRSEKLGCKSVSLGKPKIGNVAASISVALQPVFDYIKLTESYTFNINDPVLSTQFITSYAQSLNLDPNNAVIATNPNVDNTDSNSYGLGEDNLQSGSNNSEKQKRRQSATPHTPSKPGFFSRLFGWSSDSGDVKGEREQGFLGDDKLTVNDFVLLKVVGKGAFGKVMLVRKKEGTCAGKTFAMKVLKKRDIAEKGQIEHTKSERSILCEIRHPFIVRLRFAFQSQDKLYLITDYYNGGSLYYHMKKSRVFSENRTRFYGAQLLTALEHLHSQHIM